MNPIAPVFINLYSVEAKHSVWINTNEILSFEPLSGNDERSIVYIGCRGRYLVVTQTVDKIISLLGLKVINNDPDADELRRRLSGDSYFETDGERTEQRDKE